MNIRDIKIESIEIVENIRINAKDSAIVELMQNIKQNGLLHPIGVSKTNSGKYILVYGNRRMLACQKLGWKTIPAVISEAIELKDHLILNATENLQRKDISPLELGRICNKLKSEFGMTIDEMAARFNVSSSAISSAFETYANVPAKLRHKVKFMEHANSKRNGSIPASIISHIMAASRRLGLTENTKSKLMELTHSEGLTAADIGIIGKIIEGGFTPTRAINASSEYQMIRVDAVVSKKDLEAHCKEYDCRPSDLAREILYGKVPAIARPEFVK